jgi:GMP reductase
MRETKLDFCDVLMVPQQSDLDSRSKVTLERTFTFKNGHSFTALPIVASNMDTVGTVSMAKAFRPFKALVALHKHYKDYVYVESIFGEQINNVFFTVGVQDTERDRVKKCVRLPGSHPLLMIDAANGYIPAMRESIRYYKDIYPWMVICAGNVASPEGVELLADAGADIIKIGIGSGKLCNTRLKTGIGYPQFSLIQDCRLAANEKKVYLMSDGGIENPGDIAKAFGIGADFVMLGSMLAGHEECEVAFHKEEDEEYMTCYGMSSSTAMGKYHGGVASHRTCEGRTLSIKKKGLVANTIKDICGGLRSAGTYLNASNLEEFSKKAWFIQVNRQVNH